MRPGKASEVKRTWLGGGVDADVQGARGDMVPVFCAGDCRWRGRALGPIGASIVIGQEFSIGVEDLNAAIAAVAT